LELEITVVLRDACSHLSLFLHDVVDYRACHTAQVRGVFLFHFIQQSSIDGVGITFRKELVCVADGVRQRKALASHQLDLCNSFQLSVHHDLVRPGRHY
jgi:hypothetical protein